MTAGDVFAYALGALIVGTLFVVLPVLAIARGEWLGWVQIGFGAGLLWWETR